MTHKIKQAYDSFTKLPGGHFLFSRFLGLFVPYSGTIYPNVEELKPGYARISIEDRRQVRNHLKSIHAIAMMNLAELVTGLALHYELPKNARGILTNLSISYLKKGRGKLTAECHCEIPQSNAQKEYELISEIKNTKQEKVAIARAKWLIGPKEKR